MKIGWPHRLLTAVAVLMLGTWASHQALRQGWASYQSIEARAVLKRSPETGGVITAQTWSRARAGFMSAIEWDPGNPEYHQGIADLYMIRLWLTPGDRVKMAPYFEIGLRHYTKAAALRPTWPYSHAGIVTAKQQLGQLDAVFIRAIGLASRYGPWEPAVQDQLIVAGYRAWPALAEAEREAIRGNLRRAHHWRPKPAAALLAWLKAAAPPCDQLQVDIPGACAAAAPPAVNQAQPLATRAAGKAAK